MSRITAGQESVERIVAQLGYAMSMDGQAVQTLLEIVKSKTQEANPAELDGLNPRQQQVATELWQRIGRKVAVLNEAVEHAKRYATPSELHKPNSINEDLNSLGHVIKKRGVTRAQKAARKHYRQHEGAYQEQAYKEATEAGKDIKV
jgi:predicted urease superfamily metal-dependent hydrolase